MADVAATRSDLYRHVMRKQAVGTVMLASFRVAVTPPNTVTLPPSFAIRYRLGQGQTRMIWTGPAVRHPGYAKTGRAVGVN